MSIFKACDIRAPYGKELLDHHARALGWAIARLKGPVEVLVGGDARLSTPVLKRLLIESLVEAGCRVVDVGTVPTPAYNFGRRRLGIPVGVMVTASHNPPEYNGFKVSLGERPIDETDMARLRRLMEGGAGPRSGGGSYRQREILPDYHEDLAARLEPLEGLRVVVDYGNGVGALTGPALWRAAAAEVVELFADVDGRFPNRSPNPAVAGHLTALRRTVTETGAELGVAYDGDADRVAFVDERGGVVASDKVIALFAEDLLRQGEGTVVYDQKCSSLVPQRVRSAGGEPVMERSGYTFIRTTFEERGAVYAGELSGHHFFRALPQGDDGVAASLFFAGMLHRRGHPLSALAAALPDYPITPDVRLPVAPGEAERILARLAEGLAAEARLSFLDGVRAEYPDGWGLARESVTEPLLTLRFEGENGGALVRIMARFEEVAPELAGRLPKGA